MPSHAEARVLGSLVDGILATTIAGAGPLLHVQMAEKLPATPCGLPAPGELVAVPGA